MATEVNGVGVQSDRRKNAIKIDRFINDNRLKIDPLIAVIFLLVFFVIGKLESNWFLPNDNLGFLEHKNIWIFLLVNFSVPIIINLSYKTLEFNIDMDSINKLKVNFKVISESNVTTVIRQFLKVVGFCCFVGNSLQNAHLINELPFDYWDSINYLSSYIASRFYKLYLFTFFIPTVLIYCFILLISIQRTISNNENYSSFMENYEQVNFLCNFGLNVMLTLVIPFVILSATVYSIHDRFDITTTTTFIASGVCTLIALAAYVFLIKSFYIRTSQYKRENVKKINRQLTKIHRCVLNHRPGADSSKKLDMCLRKEECLCRIKENIDSISRCPHIIKAIFTIISPMIPPFLKLLFTLKYTP